MRLIPAFRVLPSLLLALFFGGIPGLAPGEEGVLVEITYLSPTTEKEEWIEGELFFPEWPIVGEDGEVEALTPRALRSRKENEVLFSARTGENGNDRFFHIQHRRGETVGRFSFNRIPVVQSSTGAANEAMGRRLDPSAETMMEIRLEEVAEEDYPVTMKVSASPQREFLEVERIVAIRGLVRPGDEPTPPKGRFVQYNRAATGSGGQVRLQAATFFGGEASEHFAGASFSPAGDAIWAIANLTTTDFAEVPQWFPDGSEAGQNPYNRETGAIVHYDGALRRLTGILRFPENSLFLQRIAASPDNDAVYISGMARHRFSRLKPMVEQIKMIPRQNEQPGILQSEDESYDKGGSFLARLRPDGRGLQWILFYPGITGLEFDFAPEGRLFTHSRRRFWTVSPAGDLVDQPSLQARIHGRAFAPIAVNRDNGQFYLGGEYHSGTGLEPWRNPFLHAFDAEGQADWTVWNWTGPLVGVRWSRLVSDSAVRQVQVGHAGDLLIRGWSDGGNSVFTQLPYDFRRSHDKDGFAGSVWGAGVLSVSYLMRMDPDTLEITAFNRWLAYLPSSGNPNATTIVDMSELPNRDVVFTGHTASAMIETHDAWVTPWFEEQKNDPLGAKPKGGPYFAVYDENFKKLRLATSVPGLRNPQLASRGQRILLSGSAQSLETAYGINRAPLLRNPVQGEFGGGETDAYLMLIHVADD